MKGSVAEAAMVAPIASAQPAREPLKYGHTRAILLSKVVFLATPAAPSCGGFITWFACDERMKCSGLLICSGQV